MAGNGVDQVMKMSMRSVTCFRSSVDELAAYG